MDLTSAKQFIIELGPVVDVELLQSALRKISQNITRISTSPDEYTFLCRTLLDKVSSILLRNHARIIEEAWIHVEKFFLFGSPSIAFDELCSALNLNSEFGEVAARILVLFVSKRTGGISRLTQVLQRANRPEVVASLLHLPSRITNVLLSTSLTESHPQEMIDENEYFGSIAEAIYNQPLTSDVERESILKDLIARMTTLRKSETLIQRFILLGNTDKLVSLVSFAPHRALEPLIRALLSQQVETRRQEKQIYDALSSLLRDNLIIRDICVHTIPFQRPLFRRPRTALKRIVRTVVRTCTPDVAEDALMTVVERWSSGDFATFEDIRIQRQITRLLLYYLRYTSKVQTERASMAHSVMMTLVDGVHARLDANDIRIRRHGMVVGEASSRYSRDKTALRFEREGAKELQRVEKRAIGDDLAEDGGDTDFSELANEVGKCVSDSEEENETEDEDAQLQEARLFSSFPEHHTADAAPGTQKQEARSKPLQATKRTPTDRGSVSHGSGFSPPLSALNGEWQGEDDWTSIESYAMTDSSEDDEMSKSYEGVSLQQAYLQLRQKISSPMSIPRLLGLLIDVNKSDGGSIIVEASVATAALRTLASRAEANFTKNGTLRSAAVELCLEVGRIDPERYPDEEVEALASAREKAWNQVIQMDIGSCGLALVERVICGKISDLRYRLEALGVLTKAVRDAHERIFARSKTDSLDVSKAEKSNTVDVGVSTRILSHSLDKWRARQKTSTMIPVVSGWDVEGLVQVFHSLSSRLCEGGGASFVQVEGRDVELWANGLVALATLGRYGGSGLAGAEMRFDVIEMAVRRVGKLSSDSVVRRSIALALSVVLSGMEDREVREVLIGGVQEVMLLEEHDDVADVGREAFEWLQQAAEGDPDIGVRRFAALTLQKWSQRVEGVVR